MFDDFSETANFDALPKLLQNFNLTIRDTIEHADFIFIRALFDKKEAKRGGYCQKADYLFRYSGYGRLKVLLDIVYQLDIFISVGGSAKSNGFSFPVTNKTGEKVLKLASGLFHPFSNKDPVPK